MLGKLVVPARGAVTHWRLVLILWLARLLPIVLLFGMPAYSKIAARSARHPDAGLLLEPSKDTGGFAYAWTADFFRDAMTGVGDTIFWLIIFCWMLVTVLAGGIVTRLVHGGGLRGGLFLAECGRYAGRLLRLAFLAAAVFYALDAFCNSVWSAAHNEINRLQHTQDHALKVSWTRGIVFVVAAYLVGLVHNYARIDMIAHERRSAVLSFLRGLGALLRHLPALFLVELGVLVVAGVAALLAWLVLNGANPLHADATSLAAGMFLLLAAATSYLRTGVEVGALEARCAVLAPPGEEDAIASQIEAALAPEPGA